MDKFPLRNEEQEKKYAIRNYSLQKDIMFIHIPKCAGSFIKRTFIKNQFFFSFVPPGSSKGLTNHLPAHIINSCPQFKNTRNFIFVRNPYDRLASNWFWQTKHPSGDPKKVNSTLKKFKNFNDFVLELPNLSFSANPFIEKDITHHFSLQKDWANEKTIFIGKKENLLEDINNFCALINEPPLKDISLDIHPSDLGTAHQKNYLNLYDRKMIDVVNQVYEEDFIFLNYDFL